MKNITPPEEKPIITQAEQLLFLDLKLFILLKTTDEFDIIANESQNIKSKN